MGVGIEIAASLISGVGSWAGAILISRSYGSAGHVQFLYALHMGAALITGVGRVMVILGILKLARPERRDGEQAALRPLG